jgi:hypothetical protein
MAEEVVGATDDARIGELFVYVAVDPTDGTEALAIARLDLTWAPMVAPDRMTAEKMRQAATSMAGMTSRMTRLVRFTAREVVETVWPSAAAFEEQCARTTGVTVDELHRSGRYAEPCPCDDTGCEGWTLGYRHEDAVDASH